MNTHFVEAVRTSSQLQVNDRQVPVCGSDIIGYGIALNVLLITCVVGFTIYLKLRKAL